MKYHFFLFLFLAALSTHKTQALPTTKHIEQVRSWLSAQEFNVKVFHCEDVGAEVEVTEEKTDLAQKEGPEVNIFYCDHAILKDPYFFKDFVNDKITLNIFFVSNWQPDPRASRVQQATEWKTFCAQFVSPENNRIICKLTTEDFTETERQIISAKLPKKLMALDEEETSSSSPQTKTSRKRGRTEKPSLDAVIPDVKLVEPLNLERITTHGERLKDCLIENDRRFVIYHCYNSTLTAIAQDVRAMGKCVAIFYCDPASFKNDDFLKKSLCSDADLNIIFVHGWRNEHADRSDTDAQSLFDQRIETVERMDLKPCVLGLPTEKFTKKHKKEILREKPSRKKKAAQPVAQLPPATVATGAPGAGDGSMADSEDDDSESAAVPTDRKDQEKIFFLEVEKEYKKRILQNECELRQEHPHLKKKQLSALSRKFFFEFFETPATVKDQVDEHTRTTSLYVEGVDKFFAVSSSFLHGKEFNDPTVKDSFLISSGRMRNVFRSSADRVKDNAFFIFFESETPETNDELEKMEFFFNDPFYDKYEYNGSGKFAPIIYRIKHETRLDTRAVIKAEVKTFLDLFFATLELNKKKLLNPAEKPARKKIKSCSDADATEVEDSDATDYDKDEHEDSDAARKTFSDKKESTSMQSFFCENLETEFSKDLKQLKSIPEHAPYLETNRRVCFDLIESLTQLEYYGKTRPKNTLTPKGLDVLIVVSSDMFNTPGCSVEAASEIFKPSKHSRKLNTTFTPSDDVLNKNIVIVLVKNGTDDKHSEKIDALAEFLRNAANPPLVCVANAQDAKDSKRISAAIIVKLSTALTLKQEHTRMAEVLRAQAEVERQLRLAREEQERFDARAAEERQRKEAAEQQAAKDAKHQKRRRFIASALTTNPFAHKILLFDESKKFFFRERTLNLEKQLRKEFQNRSFTAIRYFNFSSVISYFNACLKKTPGDKNFTEWQRTSAIGMISLVGTTDEITEAQSSQAYTELLKLITADRIIRCDTETVLVEDLARLKERFTTDIEVYATEDPEFLKPLEDGEEINLVTDDGDDWASLFS